jgi:type II secretory pathway component GspD/PulD (secretin)
VAPQRQASAQKYSAVAGNEILSKERKMRQVYAIVLMLSLAGACDVAGAQTRSATLAAADGAETAGRSEGVPIEHVIAAVAKKTGKKYLIDSRVHGNVEILGQDIAAITYGDLLSILLLSGYTAIEGSNYISVVPLTDMRVTPLPLAMAKDNYPDAQFVTTVITVKNTMAASLVPILRPLLPTYGHLAATPCTNQLLIVDNFASVKRIEKLITSLDVGTPYVPHPCQAEVSSSQGNAARP